MTYQVVVQPRAKQDLTSYFERAKKEAPMTAARWLDRFEDAILMLGSNAEFQPLAPEDEWATPSIQQLRFGKGRSMYRALFTIVDNTVHVLHIRRAVMRFATAKELYA